MSQVADGVEKMKPAGRFVRRSVGMLTGADRPAERIGDTTDPQLPNLTTGPPNRLLLSHRIWCFVGVFIIGLVVLGPLDRPTYQVFAPLDTGEADWHRLGRVAGYLPTWLIVAASFALVDLSKLRRLGFWLAMHRSLLLSAAVVLGAVLAEWLKLIARRERPNMHDGLYAWRGWLDEPFHTGGLGLPSSHAMVAFTAAWALWYLHPSGRPLWLLLAVGCAATRVINHAHFLTDVWVSATVSFVLVRALWWWHCRSQYERRLATAPS